MKTAKLRVAAAQMKFRDSPAENLEWIAETTHRQARAGVDAILFPECAVTGYNRDFQRLSCETVHRALRFLGQTAREARCQILVGCPTFAGARLFNSLLVFDRRGREIFRYSKIHLTARDAQFFRPGNSIAFFRLDGIPCTAIICHERRFPELVRLPVMMGAQILFHPNAGLDTLAVSKAKQKGKDGIAVRAFENEIFYVFANSVGPQGNNLWSAGDSKIVGPDSKVLALANNRDEMVITAELDLSKAGRKYAREALVQPAFLRAQWRAIVTACRRQLRKSKP
ncbi:MAG: carbon-nitrogen hydrolase family protein [Verrucomicrobia bacterium]|nr:carbon-nitrogen hydrolase family protein [Verrucomicrobiota bacterium]